MVGVPEEKIAELKAQHSELYMASLSDTDVVFKPLSVREYEDSLRMAQQLSSIDAEEFVINSAVLYPEIDFDEFMIGELSALADEILQQSGFADFDVCMMKLNVARQKAEEIVNFMKAMIIASNQNYSSSEIEDMTFTELAECAALAERIFEIQSQVAAGQQVLLEIKDSSLDEMPTTQEPRAAALSPEEWEEIQRGAYANPDKASTIGAAAADDPIARKLREALG